MSGTLPNSTIVIAGGGFSAIAVIANLIRKATSPWQIFIVEKTDKLARGVAYSTPENYHLLNVPGGNMGIFTDNPTHFIDWLNHNQNIWQPEFKDLPIEAGRFYPRKLYGIYLEHVFKEAISEAHHKEITITIIKDEVIDAEITQQRTALVHLSNSTLPEASHVVIATGNTPVKSFAYAHGMFLCGDKYIENLWASIPSALLSKDDLSGLPESTKIAIVGTGLTMIDAFLSLHKKGYRGEIIAISRHGKLPHPHKANDNYPIFIDAQDSPKTAYKLFKAVRGEARKAIKNGHDWRSVLQSLRPVTNELWAALSATDRRYITKRLLSYWNIHRHRVPAEIYDLLQSYITSGKLSIIPGTIYYIGGKSNGPLMVSYRKRGADIIESMPADYVINCSGPETDIARSGNKFLLKLRDKGIISVGTLRTGIELTPTGRVKGKAPDIFHAVGALLVGDKLESTAVPDIRAQAFETAERILTGAKEEDYSRYYNYFI